MCKNAGPGASLCGRAFNQIIIEVTVLDEPRFQDWFRSCIATRLHKGGKLFLRRKDECKLKEVSAEALAVLVNEAAR